jgi:hypothetical protein
MARVSIWRARSLDKIGARFSISRARPAVGHQPVAQPHHLLLALGQAGQGAPGAPRATFTWHP